MTITTNAITRYKTPIMSWCERLELYHYLKAEL